MAKQLFANNATGYLNATINNVQTSIVLQAGNGAVFPSPTGSDYFYATLYDGISTIEIVKVTARSTDTLTVVRGQEGTTAASFPTASVVELRATKATFDNLLQKSGDTATSATITTLTSPNLSSSNVSITGGSISGITDIAIADGGTGASTAEDARTNLGLGSAATLTAGTAANNIVQRDSSGYIPIGSNWKCYESGGVLYFSTGGVNKAKLDTSGNLTVVGNVTAYGTM